MNIKLVLLAALGILIFAGAFLYLGLFRGEGPVVQAPLAEEGGAALARLEQELSMVQPGGGIAPERYREIYQDILKLEAQGADPEAIADLRSTLEQLNIGGERDEAAPAEVPKTVAAPPPPKAPVRTAPPAAPKPSCISDPRPVFSRYLIDPASVNNILPPPNRPKSDLTVLKTHSYINTPAMGVPIYAPANMELVSGAHYVGGPYTLDFRVSCEVTVRLAHIVDPVQKIKDALPKEPVNNSFDVPVSPAISFAAGDLIGYVGGPPYTPAIGFDFGVYNSAFPNRFAAAPEQYTSRIYTTAGCPFDYFASELREAYRSKYYLIVHEGMQYDLPHFCQ